MKLEIVTPAKTINEEQVDFVGLESSDGSFGVLNGHMPLIAELKLAPLYYDKSGKRSYVAVMGGAVRVLNDIVTVVTEDAERAVEIDALKARKEKEDAEAYLTKKTEIIDVLKAEVQLRRALAKLKTVEVSKRM
jgi:F-type H+-transporting ATPase subunit epsilon